jgi:cell wall-associated NlpC family hydrolase
MRTGDRHARGTALLEGLLGDPRLRAAFRHDPSAICRSFDLPRVAADLEAETSPTITLEPRESRSSLTGAMVAAAAQGVGLVELALRHLSDGMAEAAHFGRTAVAGLPGAATTEHAAGSVTGAARAHAVDAHGGGPPRDVMAPSPERPSAFEIEYPAGNPSHRQIAAWMGENASAAGLPQELPVMAALSASDLTDLRSHVDDAFGFFGMSEASSHGPYSGFAKDPEKQLAWFLDRAAVVRAERVAGGHPAYGRDPSSWHEWIRAVLGRHGAHDPSTSREAAQRLLSPLPDAGRRAGAVVTELARLGNEGAPGSGPAEEAVQIARRYMGQHYLWGGNRPSTGFDCSGLVQYVYSRVGIQLPRVTDQQYAVGEHVSRDALRTGDIVFFRDATGYIHHEGLYVGDGQFLHAPHAGDVIKVSSLAEPYYAQEFAGGRRVAALAQAR